ncbi:uncharacterized protein EV420DRAFT_1551066 [Desarmillaria tabescens]|uniref:F-box domain-containing protein n=1 Tax=Armillaria tabescens TaxID=1929756 RepID=A0AA39N3Q0_ARMTA|nr:uncharacterized protein EV420DRAFT_1551066 [Desarmillaria tabescens]KAK0457036.1 hypothetical protein EV420DRAFT_1551066 [Desarmillaria tabescens]
MADVPLELIEHILDELSDHRKTLIAALTVSRAFHGRALYHLFRRVSLNTESDFHQFLALCDISPLVPSIIRSLKIVSRGREPQLPPLPNVTSLHIQGHLDDLWQIDFLAITSLTLEDLVFPTAMSFRHWLCSYPYLKTLSLSGVTVQYPAAFGAYAVARGPAIEKLSLAYVNENVYTMFLGSVVKEASRFALHSLRKLQHRTLYSFDIPHMHKLLCATRGTLRELDTKLVFYGAGRMETAILDISQVQKVNYHLYDFSKKCFIVNIRWLSYCLDHNVHPAALKQLHIHMHQAAKPESLEKVSFSNVLTLMDGILTNPRYHFLELVHFHLPAEADSWDWIEPEDFQDNILTSLPKLRSLGLLVVDFS